MAVFRIKKTQDYTVMSNYHLRDKNLSFKAKGMLSFMLSLPDDWDYSLNGLTTISKEGIKAIRNILQELEEQKYLQRVLSRKENGHYDYDYYIFEQPFKKTASTNSRHSQKGNTVRAMPCRV